MLPLCVFPRTSLITIEHHRYLLSLSPQKSHRVPHHPATQPAREETALRIGKVIRPVFDSGMCESVIERGTILLFGRSSTEEALK